MRLFDRIIEGRDEGGTVRSFFVYRILNVPIFRREIDGRK